MGVHSVISINLEELAIKLDVDRAYCPRMIYAWSVGLIGDKQKSAVKLLSDQFDRALIEAHKRGEIPHYNFFHLSLELRDRAEDPAWRCSIWAN